MRNMLSLFFVALSLAPACAYAEENEIVVTATRAPSPAERLPARIDVIDVDRARENGAVTLDAALAEIPGLSAPRAGPVGQQTSIFSGGFESNHTLVLFDGVRMDDPSTPEGVFDAGQDLLGDATRIEIVQGPMSALYGSGALGGVINILPRRGEDGFHPRLDVVAGSFETLMGAASVAGGYGGLEYAVTAEGYASEGYDVVPERIAAHTGEADGAEMTTLTGVFDTALSETLSVDVLVRHRAARADYDPGFLGDIGENPDAEIKQNDASLWRAGLDWQASDTLALRLSGGRLDTDRVLADAGVVGDSYRGERAFADVAATFNAGDWNVMLGAQSEDENISAVSFGSPIVGDQKHWGVYTAAQGALSGFDVTAALRHDDFEGFGAITTWRAGASRGFGGARVFAAYGTSYRAPSLYERFAPFFGAADLRPERSKSWEIGADTTLPVFGQDSLRLSALYRSSQIEDLIGFSGFSYANIDRADIDYAEARAELRPLDWLSLRASYGNTNARDIDSGEALLRRPRHAWSFEATAEQGPFTARLSWRQIGVRLDTTYDDFGAFAGTARVTPYEIVRASASWRASEAATIFVTADNVLDEVYEPVNGFAGAPQSLLAGVRLSPAR